ncbi:MAG: flavin monoamine oxidase family protein [Dermatophilaceae bacterium]
MEVIVVGAGLAGLTAARRLHRAGAAVTVLEASQHIGGRVRDHRSGSHALELGAQWVGRSHRHVMALVEESGATLFPGQREGGDGLFLLGNERRRYRGRLPADIASRPSVAAVLADAGRLAHEAEAQGPEYLRYRDSTADDWIREKVDDPTIAEILRFIIGSELCAEPGEVSALVLAQLDAGYFHGDTFLQGHESLRIEDGPLTLVDHLRSGLPDGAVRLGCRVHRITAEGDAVAVHTDDQTLRATACVLAVPLPLIPRIVIDPALPGPVDQALQRAPMGSVIKVAATYRRAFWRDDGLSGFVVGDGAPWRMIVDSSPSDDETAALTGFVTGATARDLSPMPSADRAALLVDALVGVFGPAAGQVEGVHQADWLAEPFVRGGYGPLPVPGATDVAGMDGVPERIVVAASDLAEENPGYMDGAVESGQAAADVVLDRLGSVRR